MLPRKNRSQIGFFLLLLLLISISSCANKPETGITKYSSYTFPVTERKFYLGLVPIPRSVPPATFNDTVDAYKETGDIAEIVMVWSSPQGIGQYDKLKQNRVITALRVYGLKPVVTLNFAAIKQIPGEGLKYVVDATAGVKADLSDPEFRRLWVEEAKKIAQDFTPDYFSLGNEINDYFYLHPEDLEAYLSLFEEAYSAIKTVSPGTKVFVVFSYEHMIENNQFALLARFSRVDLIGLTTYPWKHFDNPENITGDYYTRIKQNTSKPIAFTEIGWISSKERGSSEEEQAKFLIKFLELTKGMDIEMINWLFLHEPKLTGDIASIAEKETSTISLKNADGSKKQVYNVWLDLKALKITE